MSLNPEDTGRRNVILQAALAGLEAVGDIRGRGFFVGVEFVADRATRRPFDAQLEVASRVAEDSPALYFEIQALNEYGTESLTALLFAVERLRATVRSHDAAGFTQMMLRGRSYLHTRPQPGTEPA